MKIGYTEDDLRRVIIKKIRTDSFSFKIIKESLDSRHHDDIHYLLTVGVKTDNEARIIKSVHDKNIMLTKEDKYVFPHILNMEVRDFLADATKFRPVIIGAGPAGYFAAIKLCHAGFKPIVLERGQRVEERVSVVDDFWKNGNLKPDSNVCFGEGGAGTFSDGKLNTGNKDKGGYFKEVLSTFVKYGANETIAYKAKPHIGTDELRSILINMRMDIERLGGEVRFGHKLVDIEAISTNNDDSIEDSSNISISSNVDSLPLYKLIIETTDYNYELYTHSLILAIGHSARDTYQMLLDRSFPMEKKPFAMGVRVEHKADTINKAMYGEDYIERYGDKLPTADYKLVYHTADNRDVFSFCMCPGGYVVNSATEEGTIVVNGMSYSDRSGENSNSAIVVNISTDDFPGENVLAGAELQREIERKAYEEGGGAIPLQLYGDLSEGNASKELGSIKPEIKGEWSFSDLRNVLPKFMIDAILEGVTYFGTRIKGFDDRDTVMTAVESRTSSPVRIPRNREDMMIDAFPGIIPAGEGAGYAGGITSAAADGIKAAENVSEYLIEALIESYKTFETYKYTGFTKE